MYNTKIVCTYNTSDVFLESDSITHNEKKFICDVSNSNFQIKYLKY